MTAAEADKALFERMCEVCQRSYSSENAYSNHMSSQKHKQRVLMEGQRKDPTDDGLSSVMSSTFSLGDPISADREDVDSDAEEEFQEVVEGLKKAALDDSPAATATSPVKRPPNPRLSAQPGQDTPVASDGTATPVLAKDALPLTLCLFCNYRSPTVPLNAHHMERFHSMFVPEKKYLVNLEGLLEHLQKRVQEKHQCIGCGKVKANVFAVQTHMRDKSHCTIPYTSIEEQLDIGDFYDFRSTYSDDDESDSEEEPARDAKDSKAAGTNGGAKMPFKPRYVKLALDSRGDESESDEEWETDDDESLASDEITAIIDHDANRFDRLDRHTHHSKNDPRHHHQADGWHSHAHKHAHAVFYDEYSLHLPSGKSVGHRSLNVYYRQNLHSYPTPIERAERLAIEAQVNRVAMSAGEKLALDGEDDEDEEMTDADQQERAAGGETSMQVAETISKKAGGRLLAKRDALGMVGLSQPKLRAVQRQEVRGRATQQRQDRSQGWRKDRLSNKTERYAWHVGLGVAD